MAKPLTLIGFDADDTLWHNEHYFVLTQDHFADLLRDHTAPDTLMDRLLIAERRNIPHYGFGIKGFTLSMIETAIEVTDGKVPATVIAEILDAGREMLSHPVDLLPHAQETLEALQGRYKLVLITKGDLLDQERKLALSGLRDMFDGIEIVSDKTPATYKRIFNQFGDGTERGMMVGNSMKSDVVPMVDAGGWGIHVPHGQTWALEHAEPPHHAQRFRQIADLSELEQILT
ncbi:HAD family hydrolase [uncultured Sulfitobacter sp.]|uniref:HAD family hydrolase n=1 Tax=uncultured Sulfitobacter sp. TaxID=191468 RepID=UPI0030F6AF3D